MHYLEIFIAIPTHSSKQAKNIKPSMCTFIGSSNFYNVQNCHHHRYLRIQLKKRFLKWLVLWGIWTHTYNFSCCPRYHRSYPDWVKPDIHLQLALANLTGFWSSGFKTMDFQKGWMQIIRRTIHIILDVWSEQRKHGRILNIQNIVCMWTHTSTPTNIHTNI